MVRFDEIVASFDRLDAVELFQWVQHGWIRPQDEGGDLIFSDIDVARVRLIVECRYELEIDSDAMPVVLSLLDQVHGLRRELAMLTRAVTRQPAPVRAEILQYAVATRDISPGEPENE